MRLECPSTLRSEFTCTTYGALTSSNDEDCCYPRTSGTCCGRPLLVGGLARVAPVRSTADWISERFPRFVDLDVVTGRELARAWLSDARLEHASIASFARFTLQALALGAPAGLVADAQRAALDEVSHAQLCFALASRYTEQTLGPAQLSMEGAVTPCTVSEAAAATVREGCVSETLASLQVRRQLQLARDPHVRAALTRIAADEQRHAELAWRFVHWALTNGGAPVRSVVEQAFRESLERLANEEVATLSVVDVEIWHDHGRLTPLEERACWLDAAREVIEPCARVLLSSTALGGSPRAA